MVEHGRDETILDLAMESLQRSGKLRFHAQGASMMPTIHPGAFVEIHSTPPDGIAQGDIVLVRTAAGLRLHRVIEIRPGSLITRGDSHEQNDAPADPRDLMGRLHAVSRPRFRWLGFRGTRFLSRLR